MFESILEKLSARKKQIIWVIAIVSVFYLISAWSVGGIISFTAFYYYGFGLLTKTLGINEWLARAILIPMAALLAYSLSKMLSLTSKKARQEGTILAVTILTLFSLAAYLHTKDLYLGNDHFAWFSGESLKRYSENGNYVEVFPRNTLFHPITGKKLDLLTPEKVEEFSKKNKELRITNTTNGGVRRFQKEKSGNTQLFNEEGRSNSRYYESEGRMDLFPSNMTLHPALGKELAELTPQVLESFKSQGREKTEKQFIAKGDVWTETGYFVLRGDEIEINEHGRVPGIDLLIRIGEKGPTKYIEVGSTAGYKRKITADSDGLLYLMIGEQLHGKASVEVVITGLSIRLYQ